MKQRQMAFRTRVIFYQTHMIINDLMRCNYSQFLCEKMKNLSDDHKTLIYDIFVTMARLDFKAEYLNW